MIGIKRVVIILFVILASWHVIASSSSHIQTCLNNWAQKNQIVGVVLIINNHPYYYGYANKQASILVTRQTQFGIGSITKTFVSVMLLKLEAQGKLNIHDSIIKYLPEYPKLSNVSIQALMQMTAGFNDVLEVGNSELPLQQIEAAYKAYKPESAGIWHYSNVSYQLLGVLIEKVTHQSISQALSALITKPLNLKSISFPDYTKAKLLKQYQDERVKTSNFTTLNASGGLISNAKDLNLFIQHLFVMKDLLPKKQYKELTSFVETPTKYYAFTNTKAPQFGLGVFKWDIPSYKEEVLSYPGVLKSGFTSVFTVLKQNVIIIQSNTYNHNDFSILWPYRDLTKNLAPSLETN